ncbi:MAG: heat-shock protein [Robiginitomaculum sp.]|nr:MAG: heat-shock protein [Robiginitomaculum sp.]
MTNYDFSPLSRSFIGFDRMASLIDNASKLSTTTGYPPYNISQLNEDDYLIELAVAGFAEADLSLETHENVLSIVGTKVANENSVGEYLHRGIAERGFERRFQLADHVIVKGANLENGMLTIALHRELPEAMKPRSIPIGNSNENLINSKPSRKRKSA